MTDSVSPSPWDIPTLSANPDLDPPRSAETAFVGRRRPFLGVLFSGLILMVPTLGLYRFWLVTRKRQFYWGNTDIDGDALEYTGTPAQLLVGFLMAVLIFLPIYAALFYVTVRLPDFSGYAYMVLLPLFWFLMGYAGFRSRRFRLSRTLWRGIRFQQSGNAWVYALKRFGWSLATLCTLGLTYPLMAKSLWSYRIGNTWFGDRRLSFSGRVRTIAVPFYGAYLLMAVLVAAAVWQIVLVSQSGSDGDATVTTLTFSSLLILGVGYLAWLFVSTRIKSRFFSAIALGETRPKVRISALAVFLQHLTYVLLLGIFVTVFFFVGLVVIGGMAAGLDVMDGAGARDLSQIMRMGSSTFFVIIGLYLVFLGLWGVLSETVLAVGYWKVVARGTRIDNIDSLTSVRAAGAESPLAGEGLADALNVGAY